MPSSVGHTLAGLAVSRLFGGRLRDNWPHVLVAAAPDLDIVSGVLRNRPIDYSYRRSHSAGAAVAAGLAAGGAAWMFGARFAPHLVKGTAAYASHLLLDYFGKETESGLPLLWPASNRLFAAHRPVFKTIYSARGHFLTGLFTKRNLRRILREVALVTPALIAVDLLQRARRHRPT